MCFNVAYDINPLKKAFIYIQNQNKKISFPDKYPLFQSDFIFEKRLCNRCCKKPQVLNFVKKERKLKKLLAKSKMPKSVKQALGREISIDTSMVALSRILSISARKHSVLSF